MTAKCYGGDISRKRKLLSSRKRKKRMKAIGSVRFRQHSSLLKVGEDSRVMQVAPPLSNKRTVVED